MRFIDIFAGIGGFRVGMERAGHECVGFCEADKHAVASYTAMHLATQEQIDYLSALGTKSRLKEVLSDEYKNGEWFASDISSVTADEIPQADCWCFGAPCQNFSIAGDRAGLSGDKSNLVREIFRLLGSTREPDRPEWLIYENVKGMLSSNGGWDFFEILCELDRWGYDIEWQLFNSKYFGVPQNRERVYVVGRLRAKGRGKVFPITGTDSEVGLDIKQIARRGNGKRENLNQYRVYGTDGIAPTLNKMDGGGRQPHIVDDGRVRKLTPRECFRLQGFSDELFELAQFVNSDSQLYKQIGNSVTVNLVREIATRLD